MTLTFSISRWHGMKLNIKECKIIVNSLKEQVPTGVKISGHRLEEVKTFTDLGSIVYGDGGSGKEIKTKLQNASITMIGLNPTPRMEGQFSQSKQYYVCALQNPVSFIWVLKFDPNSRNRKANSDIWYTGFRTNLRVWFFSEPQTRSLSEIR